MTLKVFLAGEGKNELGSRDGHPAYQSDAQPGVLHALLRKAKRDGWVVAGARTWKSIRKLRVAAAHADTRNVLGVALDARESGCDVLAFSRDRDGDEERDAAIEDGITRARRDDLKIIGGVAVPTLEGWLLALREQMKTEELTSSRAAAELATRGIASTDAMVKVVENADRAKIPADAKSLKQWLARADAALE